MYFLDLLIKEYVKTLLIDKYSEFENITALYGQRDTEI